MLDIIVKVMVSQEFIPGSQSVYDQTKEDQIRVSKLVAPYEANQETMTKWVSEAVIHRCSGKTAARKNR